MDLTVKGSGTAFGVFRGDTLVSKIYSSLMNAINAKDAIERRARQRQRKCLCCAATFTSEGPHNRLCERCRTRPTGML